MPFTNAEVIVCVDGDSHLRETALWEIVQPFTDPQVAAVSGTVVANLLVFYYLCYLLLETPQLALIFHYSTDRRRDMCIGLLTPLMPFYHLIQRVVSSWAVLEEMLTRRSFRDNFVPEHVRRVTWHW